MNLGVFYINREKVRRSGLIDNKTRCDWLKSPPTLIVHIYRFILNVFFQRTHQSPRWRTRCISRLYSNPSRLRCWPLCLPLCWLLNRLLRAYFFTLTSLGSNTIYQSRHMFLKQPIRNIKNNRLLAWVFNSVAVVK